MISLNLLYRMVSNAQRNAHKLTTRHKFDFFPRAIDCEASLPFDQAWSRAYKKVHVLQSIASNAEKSDARGAKKGPFCMGILAT